MPPQMLAVCDYTETDAPLLNPANPIVTDERTRATRYAWFPMWCLEDIIIIEPEIIEKKKGSLLILAGGAEKIPGGRVIAAGPGRYYHAAMNAAQTKESAIFVPNDVRVGDWVTYGKYQSGGEPFVWEGRKFIMARSGDLCARSFDDNPIELERWVQKDNG